MEKERPNFDQEASYNRGNSGFTNKLIYATTTKSTDSKRKHVNQPNIRGKNKFNASKSNSNDKYEEQKTHQITTGKHNKPEEEFMEEIPQLENRTESSMTSSTEGNQIDYDQPELAESLKQMLTSGKIDCAICYCNIQLEASLWNCKRCYGPFHLKCIKQWVQNNPINKQEEQKQGGPLQFYMWTCPKCTYCYSEEMPVYTCFCGKVRDPEHDLYSTPHSCGEACGKSRGSSCVHPCNLQCHPGPCPPCNLIGKIKSCHCGKNTIQVKCSDPHLRFACGGICEKTLACKKHACSSECHVGQCSPCKEFQVKPCYCAKEEQPQKCGLENFSCEKKCGKPLNCGNHKCMQICHDGPCKLCPYTPDKLKTCPCKNKLPLSALGFGNRKSCLDPVPSCGLPCGKKLECGHVCKAVCHVGDCADCEEVIMQQCRCEHSKRKIGCYLARYGKSEDRIFICERVCKKLKACGSHKCHTACCNATKGNDPDGRHLCVKTCEKWLGCSKHKCDLFCHLGNCLPCPIIVNQPLSCQCGAAVKNPPLQCGTIPPNCSKRCLRPRQCGHACPTKCHFEACPPCHEHVEKLCNCGRSKVQNVKCCMEALCGKSCDKVFDCGHECGIVCHKGDCNGIKGQSGCGKRCGKHRSCGHPCTALCHPGNPCPVEEKCRLETKITCKCGNRKAPVQCGQVILDCDQACLNLQRYSAILTKGANKRAYFSAKLVNFAKADAGFILKVEAFIESFLKEGKTSASLSLHEHTSSRLSLLRTLFSKHYKLDFQFHIKCSNPAVIVMSNDETFIPSVKLSQYLKKIERKEIDPEVLPFEASLRILNINKFDSLDELERLLKEYDGQFYIESLADHSIAVHFWEKAHAEAAADELKKSHSNFSSVIFEDNQKQITEDEIVDEQALPLEENKQDQQFGLASNNTALEEEKLQKETNPKVHTNQEFIEVVVTKGTALKASEKHKNAKANAKAKFSNPFANLI